MERYNLEYLRQLHLFETLSSAQKKGYTTEYMMETYRPGELRPATEIRGKTRNYASLGTKVLVIYSRMDEEIQKAADTMLKAIDVDALAKLPREDFAETMANLYADLDFCHPFYDGNSRTLRAFISEISDKAGFYTDWGRYGSDTLAQEELYAARDAAVCAMTLRSVPLGPYEPLVERTVEILKDCKSLAQIFDEITHSKPRSLEIDRGGGVEID